jgi:cytochrome P450
MEDIGMSTQLDANLADADVIVDFAGPPFEVLARWREEDPVHWNPVLPGYSNPNPQYQLNKGFWVLTRYQDVFDASRDPLRFSSHLGGPMIWDIEGRTLEAMRAGIMGMDPPQHPQVKRLVLPPFMPRNLEAFTPQIEARAKELVDSIAHRGECEFVFEVASRLPVYTFCVLMGVPEEDRERIFEIGNASADSDNRSDIAALQKELALYGVDLAEKKRANPDSSMMSAYVHGKVDGESLTPAQIMSFFATVSVAGHETTRNTAGHFIRLMHDHPDQLELLMSDLDRYLPGAIDEVLRYAPPVMEFRRTATEDMELRGKQIKAGDKIYLSYASANRDAEVFEDPDRFDITRANAGKHLSFGTGEHVCLGARLALVQLRVLLKELLTRLPDIRPVGPQEYLRSVMFYGLKRLDVVFTPEQRS